MAGIEYHAGLCLWDVATGTELRRFAGRADGRGPHVAWPVAFLADGRRFLTQDMGHRLCVWDAADEEDPRPLDWLPAGLTAMEVTPAGTLLLAATIVWAAPQTWDWTRRLTPPRAAIAMALLALSAAVLTTQAYNPFIYFIF